MLRTEPIEFFLRALPEGFLFIFAVYALSRVKINTSKLVLSSIISAVGLFLIRMLPINYGVHTILGMGMIMMISVAINKIDVIKVIKAILLYVILQFIAEGVNIFIIQNIFNSNIKEVFENPLSKIIYGTPSLIILFSIISVYYNVKVKNGE